MKSVALFLVALVAVSRADEPLPTVTCDEGGCTGLDYEELLRRAAASEAMPRWDVVTTPGRWAPVGVDTKAAFGQPIEGEGSGESARWREALERLDFESKGLRQPVDDSGREATLPSGPSSGEVDDVAPRAATAASAEVGASPDDREFLDVVLVGNANGYHCTGVLVAPTAVLTAAHCAPAAMVGFGQRATQLLARVEVSRVVRHPQLDVALLRLARAVPLPIRPRRKVANRSAPATMVRLVGFGVDDVRHPTSFGVKRRVDVLATGWGCDRGRVRSAGCRPGAELLLTAVGGADTCRGDSGGPVLEPTDVGYRLLAITSRSTASGGAACGRGGIYVRVDAIDLWLTSLLEQRT